MNAEQKAFKIELLESRLCHLRESIDTTLLNIKDADNRLKHHNKVLTLLCEQWNKIQQELDVLQRGE